MDTTHRNRFILVVAAAALVAAGCGGGASRNQSPPAAMPPLTENAIHPMSRDQLKDGGTFTWAVDDMPANYNAYQLNGTSGTSQYVDLAVMPSVFRIDAKATPHWDPNYLASDPTLVTSPKQVVTYHINPKAAWYDGTPITWQDFYWEWKALNGTDKAYQVAAANGFENIESVARGHDDREVVVTFKTKYADWQSIFNPLYPASTDKSPQVFNEGWKNGMLTSAGPFRFDSANRTAQTVTLVRNEKWWGEPAKLDRIVFRVLDRDAQVDALANAEVDAVMIGGDANRYRRAKDIANIELRTGSAPTFNHLTFNGTSPILQDVKVRQAIAIGIDRQAIVRAMLDPLGLQAQVLNNHIFMTNQAGYQDNAGVLGTYDPTKAGQMLDEAGWALQDGVRAKNGQPLAINLVIPSGSPLGRQIAELVQNMLDRIGVKLMINTVPTNDFFDKYIIPGQFDLTMFAWLGTPFPISSSKSLYAKPVQTPTGLSVQQNYARIGSDEIDHLFDQATAELDPQKATAIANHIDALIWQEMHSLPLYQPPDIWAVNKTLANFGSFGFADRVYQNIGWMK